MGETLRFPVLSIGPATGKFTHPGADQFQMYYTEHQFQHALAEELRRGDHKDTVLIDSDLRCWKVDGVIDRGVIDEGLFANIRRAIARNRVHRIDHELTPLPAMTLQQVRDRVEAAIRSMPWEYERDTDDIIGRLIAKIQAAPGLPEIVLLLDHGPDSGVGETVNG